MTSKYKINKIFKIFYGKILLNQNSHSLRYNFWSQNYQWNIIIVFTSSSNPKLGSKSKPNWFIISFNFWGLMRLFIKLSWETQITQ